MTDQPPKPNPAANPVPPRPAAKPQPQPARPGAVPPRPAAPGAMPGQPRPAAPQQPRPAPAPQAHPAEAQPAPHADTPPGAPPPQPPIATATAPGGDDGKKRGKKGKEAKIDYFGLEYRIRNTEEFANLWHEYFKFFGEGFEGRRIQQEEENRFQEVVLELSKRHYPFSEITKDLFDAKQSKKIFDVLCDTPSLSHIKGISVSEFDRLLLAWHDAFISMNKALGKLLAQKQQIEGKAKTREAMKKAGKK